MNPFYDPKNANLHCCIFSHNICISFTTIFYQFHICMLDISLVLTHVSAHAIPQLYLVDYKSKCVFLFPFFSPVEHTYCELTEQWGLMLTFSPRSTKLGAHTEIGQYENVLKMLCFSFIKGYGETSTSKVIEFIWIQKFFISASNRIFYNLFEDYVMGNAIHSHGFKESINLNDWFDMNETWVWRCCPWQWCDTIH